MAGTPQPLTFSPADKAAAQDELRPFLADRDVVTLHQVKAQLSAELADRIGRDGMALSRILRANGFSKSYRSDDGPGTYRTGA